MLNVMAALSNTGGAPSVQRRKFWLTPITRVPCSNAAKTRNPVEICKGASNSRTNLSRYWAEVRHIVGTCGRGIAA